MDKKTKKGKFYIDEETYEPILSTTDSTGAIPQGSNKTAEEYNSYNEIAGFSAVEIKDKPPFKENCKK